MKRITLLSLFSYLLLNSIAYAQSVLLDGYIREGLEHNLALKQKEYSFEQSMEALNQAKGMFLPSMDFNTRYSVATGGRTFDIPTGQLMNPVYSTLNNLIGENTFPTIEDQSINFLRTTETDTKLTMTQPLFDRSIILNKKIQEQVAGMSLDEVNIYQRELVRDIKASYYNYMKTLNILVLLEGTTELVEENLRVSEVLHANDKVTEDAVWALKTEVRKVAFQVAEAEKQHQLAQSYFNFLLNRPLDAPIEYDTINPSVPQLQAWDVDGIMRREELAQVEKGLAANGYEIRMAGAATIPSLYAVGDVGFQGTSYAYDASSDYAMGSLVLRWNLFNGFQSKAQKRAAMIENQKLQIRQEELRNRFRLQAREAFLDYHKNGKNYETTTLGEREAKESYRIVERKYREGMARQVEIMDMRTTMTNASIERIISYYDWMISYVDFERATCLYPVHQFNENSLNP